MTAPTAPAGPVISQPGGLGRALAGLMIDKVKAWDAGRDRSRQSSIGASSIGHPCDRYLGHVAAGTPRRPQRGDLWPPIVGTSVHEWVLTQAFEDDPTWMVKDKSMPIYPGMKGTADLAYLPWNVVIDHKVLGADALKKLRRVGPSVQYQVQTHCYGKGYAMRGIRVDHVAIAAWPRSGFMTGPAGLHVWTAPYDERIADAAWLRYQGIGSRITFAADLAAELASLPRADGPCEWCPYLLAGNTPGGASPEDGCEGMTR